jgi:hypothetical protein
MVSQLLAAWSKLLGHQTMYTDCVVMESLAKGPLIRFVPCFDSWYKNVAWFRRVMEVNIYFI